MTRNQSNPSISPLLDTKNITKMDLEASPDKQKKKDFSVSTNNKIRFIRLGVLLVLCLQNSLFTVLRRYSQGVLKETYSKHEVLLFGEIVKILFSAYVISQSFGSRTNKVSFGAHIQFLIFSSHKMIVLSLVYGAMNILSFVALRNVSAGIFTICAQLKILTTASFSTVMLNRSYSWTKWRALFTLIIGVLLFSEPVWNNAKAWISDDEGNFVLGTMAVLTEVVLSGFASIYFERVIKTDDAQSKLTIWERNFQLAFGSFPVYIAFILSEGGGNAGFFGGWSPITFMLAMLGAAGGLLVALSIKYGDAILKTLATTGAIILSSLLDYFMLGGPLTVTMVLAGCIVITSIFNYTFDKTPALPIISPTASIVSNHSMADSLNGSDDEENEV